jgi:hypothetical protein
VGRLAVGASLVEQQARRPRHHLGVRPQADQPRRARAEILQRQERVALLLGLREREDRRRLGTPVGLGRDVGGEGDLVGAGEADAGDLGQPVGVLVQHRGRAVAEAGVDRRRQVRQPVRGELDVQVADRPRGVPGLGRRRGLVGADPAQRAEDTHRVGGDRPQHALAVLVDQPLGAGRADVAQRGQVGDPALAVGGVERQRPARLQLPPVARVRLPVAAHFGPLPRAQVGDRTDQRESLARLDVLHLQHGIPVVLGAEDDAEYLDRAGEGRRVGVEEGGRVAHPPKLAGGEAPRTYSKLGQPDPMAS